MNRIKNKIKELQQKPKPVYEIKIQIFQDNRIEVLGFPANYHAAKDLMTAGLRRVANYFVSISKEGQLDEKLSIKQNLIIQNQKPIVAPNGERLQ